MGEDDDNVGAKVTYVDREVGFTFEHSGELLVPTLRGLTKSVEHLQEFPSLAGKPSGGFGKTSSFRSLLRKALLKSTWSMPQSWLAA